MNASAEMSERQQGTFWERVSIPPDVVTGCWLWQGCTNDAGYGVLKVGGRHGRTDRAHRLSWSLLNGPIPGDKHILHSCDVPACVNPAHLRLGTNADNAADRVARNRGRNGSVRGAAHHCAKLTDDDVRAMREIHASGIGTLTIAAMFGVSQATAWKIVTGLLWRHV